MILTNILALNLIRGRALYKSQRTSTQIRLEFIKIFTSSQSVSIFKMKLLIIDCPNKQGIK